MGYVEGSLFELDPFPLEGMKHESVMPPFAGVSGRPRLEIIVAVVFIIIYIVNVVVPQLPPPLF